MKQWRFLSAATVGLALPMVMWLALSAAAVVPHTRSAGAMVGPTQVITQTVTLAPAADNTLYESATGALSNGAGQYLFAGTTQEGDIRRALLAYDLSPIPTGATVISATLSLNLSRTIAGETDVTLHAVSAAWGEAESDAVAEEGVGAAALPGDATWLHTFFDTDLWTTPGGDYDPAPLATTAVDGFGRYAWASAELTATVAAWLADPDANFGLALVGDESAEATAKRFDSREGDPDTAPHLTITYTAEAEQASRAFVPAIFK